MLAAASPEKNSHPQFFHSLYSAVWRPFLQIPFRSVSVLISVVLGVKTVEANLIRRCACVLARALAGRATDFEAAAGGIAPTGRSAARPLGRGPHLRQESARLVFRARLCRGQRPAVPDGAVEAYRPRPPGGSGGLVGGEARHQRPPVALSRTDGGRVR